MFARKSALVEFLVEVQYKKVSKLENNESSKINTQNNGKNIIIVKLKMKIDSKLWASVTATGSFSQKL